ncbi:MAG TPA: alpha/beta fold hydrolase [Thermoplasmata archaeon]|nr:alpha/beta fold hydrolase [Thermoplasmata archaeon]
MAHLPSVTADGESVLFISDESGLPLPWAVPGRGGTASPLWSGSERVGSIHASPTGPEAIISVDAGGNEHWQLARLDLGERGKSVHPLTSDPQVIHVPGKWAKEGGRYIYASNARDRRFFDIHELSLGAPHASRVLLTGDATHDVVDVAPGRLLVARANTNLDIDLLLVEGDRTVHLNPHPGEVTVQAAAFGVDGVYAAANPDRELAGLLRYRPGSTRHEFVREFAGELELIRPSPVSSSLLLSVNRQGWSEVHLFDPSTGEDRVFNSGPKGVVESVSWYPDGSAFAYGISSVGGLQLYRRDVQTGKEKRLAGPASTPKPVSPPMIRQFLAEDRVAIPYWEYPPGGPARGTLVWVHGGPESQARPGFAPALEFLVGEGWRVIAPNVRGSTGYGRTFTHLDDVRLRMNSVRDLRDLAHELIRQKKAEPGRIGIVGGSYGGFMVLSAISTYPDLWGAAVDIVGIANLVTFLERTGPWRRRLREAEYGSLDTDREFLASISPLTHSDAIETPLLVIHGKNDPRVPLHEAEQIVTTLKGRGRKVDLLVFEDEGHGLVRRENRVIAWERASEWLERELATPHA